MVMASARSHGETPDGCLRDHSARQRPGTTTRPSKPARKDFFLAFDDPSPFAGLKLVRPRRYAAAGAPAWPLPARRREPGSCEEDPEKQSGQPGGTTHVTGPNSHALLTPVAHMGAALRSRHE